MKTIIKTTVLLLFISQGLSAQILQETTSSQETQIDTNSDIFSNNVSSCVEEFDDPYKIKNWAYYKVNLRYKHCLESRSYHKIKSTLQAMIISKKYVLINDGRKVIKVNRELFTKFNEKLLKN